MERIRPRHLHKFWGRVCLTTAKSGRLDKSAARLTCRGMLRCVASDPHGAVASFPRREKERAGSDQPHRPLDRKYCPKLDPEISCLVVAGAAWCVPAERHGWTVDIATTPRLVGFPSSLVVFIKAALTTSNIKTTRAQAAILPLHCEDHGSCSPLPNFGCNGQHASKLGAPACTTSLLHLCPSP